MTPTCAPPPAATPLDLAATWAMTRGVVQRHFNVFATLAAAFVFLPSALFNLVVPAAVIRMPDPLHPLALPPGLVVAMIVLVLINMLGWFGISAIAADPSEGGGRPVGAILRGVVPAIGRAILAGLLIFAGAFAVVFVLLLIGGIVAVAAGMGGAAGGAGGVPAAVNGLAGTVGTVAIVVAIWGSARLAPLPGILLREALPAPAALRRAWLLSRGSGSRLVLILIATTVVTSLAQLFLGSLGRQLGGGPATFILGLVRDAVVALVTVYYYAAIGIVYRQLARA